MCNKFFDRVFRLTVNRSISPSGHSWIINKMTAAAACHRVIEVPSGLGARAPPVVTLLSMTVHRGAGNANDKQSFPYMKL